MVKNLQSKNGNISSLKVHLTYDTEIDNKIVKKEIPFVVGVLSDLSGNPDKPLLKFHSRKFVEIDRDNFNIVLEGISPRLTFEVDNKLTGEDTKIEVKLRFKGIEDFHPENIVKQIEPLNKLVEARQELPDLLYKCNENDKADELLLDILSNVDALQKLYEEAGMGIAEEWGKNTESMINARIVAIDKIISRQINEIMHSHEFQKLEASWRGLHYLVNHSETGEMLKIKVMNVTKIELLKDTEKSIEFDQSILFKHVYSDVFGVFGEDPFGVLIGDYEFSNYSRDITILENIAGVAEAAHTPFISAASPKFFNCDSITGKVLPFDIDKTFQSKEYFKWESFRNSKPAMYVVLTLPRFLLRLPYGQQYLSVKSFNYEEGVDGTVDSKYLWGNSAFALGTCMTNSFARYNWIAAISGLECGGLVDGLPVHIFKTNNGDTIKKCPIEIALDDIQENVLTCLGFVPLVHCKNSDYAVFFSTRTANKPVKYDTDFANANAQLSSQLQFILAKSRFAHYIMCIMRNETRDFYDMENIKDHLNSWISNYVLKDDDASQEMKAKFPLREARVEVVDDQGKYRVVVYLIPHYQLDELTSTLRVDLILPLSQ